MPARSTNPVTTRSATRRPRQPATSRAWMSEAKSAQARMANPCLAAMGMTAPVDSRETSEPVAIASERKTKPQTANR